MLAGTVGVMTPRRRLLALGVVGAVLAALLVMPISSRLIRLAQMTLPVAAVALVLSLTGHGRARRGAIALGIVPLAVLFALVAPSRPVDASEVRAAYVSELRELQGTRYVWGGEGGMGIDCSGLPRKAMLDATLKRAVASVNPTLLRRAAGIWWNDLSARAFGEQHQGSTVPVTEGESIRTLDHSPLEPGDLAVTRDGQHLLVFLERDRWIQADPNAGKVIQVRAGDDNHWLSVPVRVVRWRALA